jgi:hypothetical protein
VRQHLQDKTLAAHTTTLVAVVAELTLMEQAVLVAQVGVLLAEALMVLLILVLLTQAVVLVVLVMEMLQHNGMAVLE